MNIFTEAKRRLESEKPTPIAVQQPTGLYSRGKELAEHPPSSTPMESSPVQSIIAEGNAKKQELARELAELETSVDAFAAKVALVAGQQGALEKAVAVTELAPMLQALVLRINTLTEYIAGEVGKNDEQRERERKTLTRIEEYINSYGE